MTPNAGESREEFMDRCMSDEAMQGEYPDEGQRQEVCAVQWDEKPSEEPEPVEETARGAFKDRHPEGQTLAVEMQLRAVNEDKREILHMITSPSVDRIGDVVEPMGADLSQFHGTIVRDHIYATDHIVGKGKVTTVDEKGIWARTSFANADGWYMPMSEDIYRLSRAGIGGWSIGFRPIEYQPIEDEKGRRKGFRFQKWALIEYSYVPIPANPDIVNHALSKGLIHEENVEHLFSKAPVSPDLGAAGDGPKVDLARVVARVSPAISGALRTLERAEAARILERNARKWQT